MNAILGALKSKTMWAGIITIVVTAVSQPVQDYITAHPGTAGTIAGLALMILRTFTTQSLASKASGPPSA